MLVAVLEVVSECPLEEVVFLSDIGNCLLDVLECQLGDVCLVDEDSASLDLF